MYVYGDLKQSLFTEDGSVLFLKIRDQVKALLAKSGAVTMSCAMRLPNGVGAADSWELMACVDRMIEIGELREVPTSGCGQDRIFVAS